VLASPPSADGGADGGDSDEEPSSVYYEPAWGEVLAEAFASLVPPEKWNLEVPAPDDQRRLLDVPDAAPPDSKGGNMDYLSVSKVQT